MTKARRVAKAIEKSPVKAVAPAPAPMRMKPNVRSLQMYPKHGHTHFVATIPTVNRDKSFLIVTHWNFKAQDFHTHINENGSAVDLFFEKPYKRKWYHRFFGAGAVSLAVVEMP